MVRFSAPASPETGDLVPELQWKDLIAKTVKVSAGSEMHTNNMSRIFQHGLDVTWYLHRFYTPTIQKSSDYVTVAVS